MTVCRMAQKAAAAEITATYWLMKIVNPLIGDAPDRQYARWRLLVSLVLSAVGGVGLWSCLVTLPAIQNEFGITRGGASLPYTATMVGFSIGGVLMGRLADRF